jgi:hypothetical protein
MNLTISLEQWRNLLIFPQKIPVLFKTTPSVVVVVVVVLVLVLVLVSAAAAAAAADASNKVISVVK